MATKKSVPKESIGKFKVVSQRLHLDKHVSGERSFYLSNFPYIPLLSKGFHNVLARFNTTDFERKLSRSRKKGNRVLKKKLNGFIAFRTYYSRSVHNVDLQRQLSSFLATAWQKEGNKEVWNRFAAEYSAQATDMGFPQWLDNVQSKTENLGFTYVKYNNMTFQFNEIEDVFLPEKNIGKMHYIDHE